MSSPPTTLGQYQIIREIARSNDIVYEAYDPLMNRRVAVKELAMPAGMTEPQKEDRINRFKREAQAAGTLNHANIMTVYSFAEEAGRIFMALEFLDGHTLRNEIDTKGFIPIDRAIEIACEVLEGLGHAHSKGVIHRDIKPDNIQILSNNQVKITDFGIARLTFQPNLTMDGQVFGTPSYMSPEQVVGRDIDARSDLFSVAVVLYEMIAGQKPFAGDSVVSITYAIMNKEPSQPAQCTWSLWQVLSRALDKSPQLRYGSASEMIEALRDAERQAKSGTMAAAPAYPAMPPGQTGAYIAANPGAGQGANPYGQPPPPILSPYAQAPSPYPTAYNPYQPQQTQAQQTPYAYGPPPNIGQTYAPMPMHSMPPPGPVPVYYPPPPRAPLLKPDTVVFLRTLLVTAAILGTLLALLIVGVSAAVRAYQMGDAKKLDRENASVVALIDKQQPIDVQIRRAKQILDGMPANGRVETAHNAAVLYEELGRKYLTDDHPDQAELAFKEAIDLDRTNPLFYTDLGALYDEMAVKEGDSNTKIQYLVDAGHSWESASQFASDSTTRALWGDAGSKSLLSAASMMQTAGAYDRQTIRNLINDAREMTPSGSPLRGQAEQMLDKVS